MFLISNLIGWLATPLIRSLHIDPVWAKRLVKIGLTVLAVVIAVTAFLVWLGGQKDAAVEADRAAASAEALSKARAADQRAGEVSHATQDRVERENTAARDAAAESDDPLAEMFRKLRER